MIECNIIAQQNLFELWVGAGVSSPGSVDDISAVVDQEWHDWLVLSTVPRHVSWLPHSVSVSGSVVLVVDWSLSHPPLLVGITCEGDLWQLSSQSEIEEVWVV